MDDPAISATPTAPADLPPPPHLSRADVWTTALVPLAGVLVMVFLAFVAFRLVRRYVEKG